MPGAWLSVGGDLQLHLLENRSGQRPEPVIACRSPIRISLWNNDVPSLVEELCDKGLDVLENRPRRAPF